MDIELLEALRGVIKSEILPIQADISAIKVDIAILKEGQASLEKGQASLQEGQAILQESVADLKEETVLINRRVSKQSKDIEKIRSAVANIELEHGKKLQALVDAQVVYEDKHMQHEPRIVRLETEVDRMDSEVRSIRAAK